MANKKENTRKPFVNEPRAVRLPGNTDEKAMMGGTNNILNDIESTIAMSIGSVFFDQKATISNFAQLKGKASGKSKLLESLGDIAEAIKDIYNPQNENYKKTYAIFEKNAKNIAQLVSPDSQPAKDYLKSLNNISENLDKQDDSKIAAEGSGITIEQLDTIISDSLNNFTQSIKDIKLNISEIDIAPDAINPSSAKAIGNFILKGIEEGLSDKGLTTVVEGVSDNIIDIFKEELDIHSPSKKGEEIGRFTLEGIIEGLQLKKEDEDRITQTAKNIVSLLSSSINKELSELKPNMDIANTISNYENIICDIQAICERLQQITVDKSVEDNTLRIANILSALDVMILYKGFNPGIIKEFESGLIALKGLFNDNFNEVITAINNSAKLTDESVKSINSLNSFIDLILKIGGFKLMGKIFVAKANLKLLDWMIVDSIGDICKTLAKAAKKAGDTSNIKKLNAIISFLNTVNVLANIDLRGKRWQVIRNLNFIEWCVVDSIVEISKTLKEAEGLANEQINTIKVIASFYELITSIGDKSFWYIFKAIFKVNMYKDLISEMMSVMEDMPSEMLTNEASKRAKAIADVFAIMGSVRIPSIKSSLMNMLKLTLLEGDLIYMGGIISTINNIGKLVSTEQVSSIIEEFAHINNLINKINEINSEDLKQTWSNTVDLVYIIGNKENDYNLINLINYIQTLNSNKPADLANVIACIGSIQGVIEKVNEVGANASSVIQPLNEIINDVLWGIIVLDGWVYSTRQTVDAAFADGDFDVIKDFLTNVATLGIIDEFKENAELTADNLTYTQDEVINRIIGITENINTSLEDIEPAKSKIASFIAVLTLIEMAGTVIHKETMLSFKDVLNTINDEVIPTTKTVISSLIQIVGESCTELDAVLKASEVGEVLLQFIKGFAYIFEFMGRVFSVENEDLTKQMNRIIETLITSIANYTDMCNRLKNPATEVVNNIIGSILSIVQQIVDKIDEKMQEVVAELSAIVGNLMDVLLKMSNIEQYEKSLRMFNNIMTILFDAIDAVQAKVDELVNNEFIEKLKPLKEYYDKLTEIFNLQVSTGTAARKAAVANGAIQDGLSAAEETAVKGEQAGDNAKKSLDKFKNVMIMVVASAALLIFAGLVMTLHPDLALNTALFAITLVAFVGGLLAVVKYLGDGAKDAMEGVADIVKLVVACGALLLFAGTFISIMGPQILINAIGFGLILAAFVGTIVWAINKNADGVKESLDGLKDIAILVVYSGATLVLGSLIYHFIDFKDLLGFSALLFAFIAGLVWVISKNADGVKDSFEGLKDMALLVVYSGATLILGSLIYHFIDVKDLLGFSATLFLFIAGLTFVYAFASKQCEKSMEGLKDFAILVAASGLTLIIGSLLFHVISWTDLFGFGLMLALFVAGITFVYAYASKQCEHAMKGLYEFTLLVVASAFVLLLGGLVLQSNPWLNLYIPLFGAMLVGFIWGITWAYNSNAKNLEKAFKPALALALLTVVSAFTLVYGAKQYRKIGWQNVWGFTAALLLYVGGMTLVCKVLSSGQSSFIKGAIALGILVGVTFLVSIVFRSLAKTVAEMNKYDFKQWASAIGGMGIILGVFAAMVYGLGLLVMGPQAMLLAAGAAALGILTGLILMVSVTARHMANTIQELDKLKNVKLNGPKKAIASFVDLVLDKDGFGRLGSPITAIKVGMAAKAMRSVGSAISEIAEGVKDYAELKIPVYTGKKKTGYRSLTNKDFDAASRNVAKIITTLGGAIIKTYEKNPQMFETNFWGNSPFSKAVKSFKTLGPLITNISKAVKTYADLKIADYTYDEKTGKMKITGYTYLTEKNFDEAGKNVKKIITTLGGAIINAYTAHPEMFETNFWGNSPFGKAVKSFKTLGPLISSIGNAVAKVSNLQVATDWDYKDGKMIAKEYRQLNYNDFDNAATNVGLIITTLGGAIIDAYNENPQMFETNFWGNSPFGKAVKSFKTLAPLISSIAGAVAKAANLEVATDWDYKDGKMIPKEYRHLDYKDFDNAATNVGLIITTLGGAVIDAYNAHPDMFETNFWGNSPFGKAVKSFKTLGPLISSIAQAVAKAANLQVGDDFQFDEKTGKMVPHKYIQLSNKDFKNAAKNVSEIITTLGGAIIKAYEKNPDMFDGSGFLGMGSSPFAKVTKALKTMGPLISSIATAVEGYANMKIATKWNDKGKPIDYLVIKNPTKYFNSAATNISKIITTISESIFKIVKEKPEYFDDGDDSYFAVAMKAVGNISNLVKGVAEGVKTLAEGAIPEYDKDGKIIGMKKLDSKDYKGASEAIEHVITAIAKGIADTVAKYPDYFDDGEDSEFVVAINAVSNISNLVKNVADGIVTLATGGMPIYDKEGKVIGQNKIGQEEINKAKSAIQEIITAIGSAIVTTITNHPDWFDDGEDSEFAVACNSIGNMGDMVKNTADAITTLATGGTPIYNKDGVVIGTNKVTTENIKAAQEAIGAIIGAIGSAIVNTIGEHKDWFDDGEDSVFAVACNAISNMGDIVGSIADAVVKMGAGVYTLNGKEYKISTDDYKKCGETISSIISSIGKGIMYAVNINKELFQTSEITTDSGFLGIGAKKQVVPSPFMQACESLNSMTEIVSVVADAVVKLGAGTYIDADGKAHQITAEHYSACGVAIGDTIGAIANGIYNAVNGKNTFLFRGGEDSPVQVASKAIGNMTGVIASIADAVIKLSTGGTPIMENGVVISTGSITPENISAAKDAISSIITAIGDALVDVAQKNKEMFDMTEHGGIFTGSSPVVAVAGAISKMSRIITSIANVTKSFALGIPKFDSKGKFVGYEKIDWTNAISSASSAISTIISGIGEGLKLAYEANPDLYKEANFNSLLGNYTAKAPALQVVSALNKITPFLNSVMKMVITFAKGTPKLDGKGKVIGYDPIKATDITAAKKMIVDVIGSIGTALKTAYNNNQGIFIGEKCIAMNIANAFAKIAPQLTNIANFVKYCAVGFPVYGEDGKFKNYIPLDDTKINDAQTKLTSMINAIGTGLYDAYNNANTKFIIDNHEKISEGLSNLSNVMGSSCDLAQSLFDSISQNKFNDKTVSAYTSLIKNITTIVDVLMPADKDVSETLYWRAMYKRKQWESASVGMGSLESLLTSFIDCYKSCVEALQGLKQEANFAATVSSIINDFGIIVNAMYGFEIKSDKIDEFYKTSFDLFNKIVEIAEKTKDTSNELSAVDNKLGNTFNAQIVQPLKSVDSIVTSASLNTVNIDNFSTNVSEYLDKIETILDNIKDYVPSDKDITNIKAIISTITDINNIIYKINVLSNNINNNLTTVDTAIQSIENGYNSFVTKLRQDLLINILGLSKDIIDYSFIINMGLDALVEIFNKLYTIQGGTIQDNSKIKALISDIDEFNKTISNFDNESIGYTNICVNSIKAVTDAILATKTSEAFRTNTEQLKNFVTQTINCIDEKKIDKFIALTESLNNLADKTTNLDQLTNAIGENLTDVLSKLSDKMEEAKETFKTIETIQKKRHILIDNSIKKINGIMTKEIMITVKAAPVADATTDPTPGGSTPTPQGNSGGGTGTGDQPGSGPAPSPVGSAPSPKPQPSGSHGSSVDDVIAMLSSGNYKKPKH